MEELVDTSDYHPSLHDITLSRACEQKFFDNRLREFDPEGEGYRNAYKAGETIIVARDYEAVTQFERAAGDDCRVLAGFIIDPLAAGPIQAVHRYGGCPFYADAYDWLELGWYGIHDWDDYEED